MSEEQELKIGDVVTHQSDPEVTGVIRDISGDGRVWVDYNISCPPNVCEHSELTKITHAKQSLAQST